MLTLERNTFEKIQFDPAACKIIFYIIKRNVGKER